MEHSEDPARARLLWRLTIVMMALVLLGALAAVLEPRNDHRVTAGFYGTILAWLGAVALVLRRRRTTAAAWLLALMFWLVIAGATVMFGGLQGQNASCFTVCVLLVGSLVGGRAAIVVGLVSAAWCGGVALAESRGALPESLAPYSPINAWAAVTVTLVLTAVLLAHSLDSLRAMHGRAERSARERDEALRRSIAGQKMELVGKVTAGIAHDFNNLLTVMISVAEVLRRRTGDGSPDTGRLLDALDEATTRATLLARQLVSLGQGPHGRAGAGGEAADVGEVVGGLARMLPHLLGSLVTVEARMASGAIAAAPRAAVEQIVLNLAMNAKEAMPDGGRLRLAVEAGPSRVTIVAEDDGVGMDAATRDRIFEPFFTTKSNGTGLGLATVQRLVGELGGAVDVASEPGRGARFTVSLPRASEQAVVAAPPQRRRRSRTPAPVRRVLVVEDDPLVRRATTQWLVDEGFEAVPVANGAQALALVDASPDLVCVVSDVAMPVMDGEQLAARLASLRPELPVVLMSGDRSVTPAANGPRRAFVAKPMAREALLAAMDEVMAASSASAAASVSPG